MEELHKTDKKTALKTDRKIVTIDKICTKVACTSHGCGAKTLAAVVKVYWEGRKRTPFPHLQFMAQSVPPSQTVIILGKGKQSLSGAQT